MRLALLTLVVLFVVQSLCAQQRWLLDSTQTRKDTIYLREVEVTAHRESPFLISRVSDIEAGAIYAAKKTERIKLENVIANLATNNSRQTFATVAGLNIWESDAAGLQLGIGGRGLNPNRTSNFTTRQNGYDISADPLGYPESYYVPPMMALDRIDIVRGAGALRYGTQFGGVVNFVMKEGSHDAPLAADVSLTAGSFGFGGAFARVGGTTNSTNYVAMYQFRRADGWRPNSGFSQHLAYAALTTNLSTHARLRLDYTFMTYLAQQPGGLTDQMFTSDPSQSVRARNWFNVNWNLASLTFDWFIS
ncbi:MAG: TonB-dependent receptor plug domain-containing protein, partial [Candidatus Kapabacteria bacterium]|nr:TonB-dependent receptor plug domain-containing protein [Candidatus Kapabacteria bacterium]